MSAGFGGAIKLTGESEYRRALENISRSLRATTSELKATASGFEVGEKSSKEMAQETTRLKSSLDTQKRALSELKAQLSKLQTEYSSNSKAHKELTDRYEKEKQKLEQLEKAGKQNSAEYKEQRDKVAQLAQEVADSTKKHEAQGKALDTLRKKTADTETATNRAAKEIANMGKSAEQASTGGFTVMKGALADLVSRGISSTVEGAKNLVRSVFEAGSSFESQMSKVSAISGATGDDMLKLRDKAKEMGATTKFTATQSGEAFEYMAMAGWKTNDMLDGISGVMQLAAASGEDLGTVSDIVTDALTAMGLKASDSAHFADVLAAASSNANTNVGMMGATFQYAAPVAGALGYSIEDTALAIGLMANAGIKGEMAGTSLRAILTRLAAPPKEAADAMDELGLSITNADGTMKPFRQVLDELRTAFDGMGEAEKTSYANSIAGKNAMSGLLAIVNAAPSDYDKLASSIDNANGSAKRMSDQMNDNVGGQLTLLKSQVEGIMIQMFDSSSESIRRAVTKISETLSSIDWNSVAESIGNALSGAVDVFNWILDHKDLVVGALTAIGAAFTVFKTLQGISSIISVFQNLAGVLQLVSGAQAVLNTVMAANPFVLIVAVIAGLVAAFVTLWNTNEGFRNAIISAWDGIKNAFSTAWESISGFFTNFGTTLSELPAKVGEWLSNVISNVANWASEMGQNALNAGQQFLDNVVNFFQQLPYNVGYFIGTVLGTIVKFAIEAPQKAMELGKQFLDNVVNFFQQLPSNVANFLTNVINKVVSWRDKMVTNAINAGRQFLTNVVNFFQQLPSRVWGFLTDVVGKVGSWAGQLASKGAAAARNLFNAVVNGIQSLPQNIANIGRNIVQGLWNGITGMTSWIQNKVGSFAKGILDGMKRSLGIHSPSRVFRDQVGKFIAQGIGVGFEDEMKSVSADMQNALPTSFDLDTQVHANGVQADAVVYKNADMVGAFKTALSQMKIELDDNEVGKFVDTTVSRLVYA